MSDPLSRPAHAMTVEDVLPWECVYGECDHDECPATPMQVCLGCSDQEPNDEGFITYTSWERAESWAHTDPDHSED